MTEDHSWYAEYRKEVEFAYSIRRTKLPPELKKDFDTNSVFKKPAKIIAFGEDMEKAKRILGVE